MIRILRAACVAAALLGLSPFADAGPLRWGYRAEAPDGTVLREVSGLADLVWSDAFLPNPHLYGTKIPDLNPDDYQYDIWRSSSTVTIIDERSGQTGSFPLYLDYVEQYLIRPDGSRELIYQGENGTPWPGPTIFTLGGSTYTARSPGGELFINVVPGPGSETPGPVSATPEPGGLALASLGLAAVLGGRLRRVRVSRGAAPAARA